MVKERTTSANKSRRTIHNPLFHCLLILFVGLIAYINAFHVPFVFDDVPNIAENARIRSLSNISSLFFSIKGPPIAARPLTAATFAVNYYLNGLDTTGYHVFNLTLHLINGLLLYALIKLTAVCLGYGRDDFRVLLTAVCSSLIFVAHPIQTETVTYIVTRSTLLATTFFLSGMILFVKAVVSERQKILYTVSLVFISCLGMASREEFFLFPFMLILYDYFFLSKFNGKEILRHYRVHLPVLLTLSYLLYIVLTYDYEEHAGFGVKTVSSFQYFMTQFNVHWTYIRLLFFPVSQNLDYDYPVAKTLFELPTILSFLGYVGLWTMGIFFSKRKRVISFCILWFMITLVPSSSIIPAVDVIFEHRLYMPLIGYSILTIMIIFSISDKLLAKHSFTRAVLIQVLAIVLVLTGLASARNTIWNDEIALWQDVVEKSPKKARAHNNLGVAYNEKALQSYSNKSMLDDAITHLSIATQLNPSYAAAHNNLGAAYADKGMTDRAIEHYEIAITLDPSNYKAHFNLGTEYIRMGLHDKGIDEIKICLQINPHFREALIWLDKVKSVDR